MGQIITLRSAEKLLHRIEKLPRVPLQLLTIIYSDAPSYYVLSKSFLGVTPSLLKRLDKAAFI